METTSKPSWTAVLQREAETCPSWYAESLEADERRFWDEAVGAGFYDWYLEHREESAYAASTTPPREPPPLQLFLAGLAPLSRADSFHIRSF